MDCYALNSRYLEQQGFLSTAAIAAYVSLNKIDQRKRFRAIVNLRSVLNQPFDFSKGSSSSGLGYALAVFQSWWTNALTKSSAFSFPVFATGEILNSGEIKEVGHISSKVNAVIRHVSNNDEVKHGFYLCVPEVNLNGISADLLEQLKGLNCILIAESSLQKVLGELLGESYDGDPLGRWEPFKGLKSFEYEDSIRFFGRDKDVQRLSDDLNQNQGLLIVSGASGTGKSSLIKAGLIPCLEQKFDQFYWCSTTPSQRSDGQNVIAFLVHHLAIAYQLNLPIQKSDQEEIYNHSPESLVELLITHIKSSPKRFLLYIDQYEEIYSTNPENDEDHSYFLEVLNKISNALEQIKIVIALRNEYLGKLLESHALRSPIITNIPSQLSLESWESIVFEQAQFSGISFETNSDGVQLQSVIIEQASRLQNSLPMVGFLLEQLYLKGGNKGGESNLLTFESYESIGGLTGAIATRAQSILDSQSVKSKLIDSLFELFVGLNSESLPYARHVDIADLRKQRNELYELVLGFIDANLIIYISGPNNSGQVRFAHDSLFSSWATLNHWIDDSRDYLIWRNSIDGLYQRWREQGYDKKYLLKDKALVDEGLFYLSKNILGNQLLGDYINKSRFQSNLFKINLFVFMLLIPALVGGFFYWDHTRVKVYTYEEIGKKWEVPFGINEIGDQQIKRRNYHYALEYQGGKLRRVKKLNSVRNYYGQKAEDSVAQWDYSYADSGKVNTITEKTRSGKTALINYYQFSSNGSAIIRYSQNIEKVGFSIIAPKNQLNLRQFKGKSEIARKLLNFYENGLLKQISYQDASGRPVADYKGSYGSIYEYNDIGLIIKSTDLNKTLEPSGNTQFDYQYDLNNRKSTTSQGGLLSNLQEERITRDHWGNVIETSRFINLEAAAPNGLHKEIRVYDDRGNLIEISHFDLKGQLTPQQLSFPAKVKMKYDENGNLSEISYYGVNDHLIIHRADGFALNKMKFNDNNQLVKSTSFGISKEPILRETPIASGLFKNIMEYDSRGNQISESYFGIKGEPIVINQGYHRYESKYDQYDQIIEQRLYGIDNKPTLGKVGLHLRKFEYDERGNVIKASDFGINGEPIINKDGYHAASNQYDDKGNVIEEATYDTEGDLMLNRDGVAIVRQKQDDFGNLIELSMFDKFSQPALGIDGWHKAVQKFADGGAYIQRPSGFEYYGINHEPVLNFEGVHRSETRYDSKGRMIHWANYGINGELVLEEGETHTSMDVIFHPNGKQKRSRFYSIDGAYEEAIYDTQGNALSISFYDKNHIPVLGVGDFSGYSKIIYEYDGFGNKTKTAYLDQTGNPGVTSFGFSKVIYKKDRNGVLTDRYDEYDINDQLINYPHQHQRKITTEEDDLKFWEFLRSMDTKQGYKYYLSLVDSGIYSDRAKAEISSFNSLLKVSSEQQDVQIFLDGEYVGINQVEINLRPGKYQVTTKKKGYQNCTKDIILSSNKTLDIKLPLEKDASLATTQETSELTEDELIKLASSGNPDAQKNLGNLYRERKMYKEAMHWYLKSAEQGYHLAMNNIGVMYEFGEGVQRDEDEAIKWYSIAAKNGVPQSQSNLGILYYRRSKNGTVTQKKIDKVLAHKYLSLGSEQGMVYGDHDLGFLYLEGYRGKSEPYKAIELFERSFKERNFAPSANAIGFVYLDGLGVPIDVDRGIYWYEKAASKAKETSDWEALKLSALSLYSWYLDGTSFFKDREKGLFWLSVGVNLKDQRAIKKLKEMQEFGK